MVSPVDHDGTRPTSPHSSRRILYANSDAWSFPALNNAIRRETFRWFRDLLPNPTTELVYRSPFELLVAVVLSAQATLGTCNHSGHPTQIRNGTTRHGDGERANGKTP